MSWLEPFKKAGNNYTLYGILFGAIFPILATWVQMIEDYHRFSIQNLILVQLNHPLLWIIDSAPIWLGLFAGLGGASYNRLKESTRNNFETNSTPYYQRTINNPNKIRKLSIVSCVLVSLVGITTSTFIWANQHSKQRNSEIENLKALTEIVKNNIENFTTVKINSLIRMAKRWEHRGGMPKEEWFLDAKMLYQHEGGFQAIEWIDSSYIIQWIEPFAGNESAVGLDISFEGKRREALYRARTGGPTVSKIVKLVQGVSGFLVYVPIQIDKNFHGFIAGVFDLHKMTNLLTVDLENKDKSIKIYEDNELIFENKPLSPVLLSWKSDINIGNQKWVVQIGTTSLQYTGNKVGFLFGLIISLLLGFVSLFGLRTLATQKDLKQLNQNLVDANIKVEESAKSKSEFLATMSHEIRTPIHAIQGMNSLLLETSLNDEQADYAYSIGKASDTLSSVINDILDISKLEAGKIELESIPFDFEELIHESAHIFFTKAGEKQVNIILISPPEKNYGFFGDPARIRQIVINLLSNALKFTDNGAIFVRLQLEPSSTPLLTNVLLEVKDSGVGISKENLSKLFQKFSQADQTITRKYGGTGLGLSICKSLTDLMGGEIGAESEEGKGSRFWIRIPLKPTESTNKKLSFENLKGANALIISDSVRVSVSYFSALEEWMLDCQIANRSFEDIQAKIKEQASLSQPFNFIIFDHLGASDPLLKEVQKLNTNAKIISLYSIRNKGDNETMAQLGVAAYLPKPVLPKELLKTMFLLTEQNKNGTSLITPQTLRNLEKPDQIDLEEQKISGKVLIAEDNPINQKIVLKLIQKMGLEQKLANNGEEALQKIQEEEFDLVLMDCQMPIMDGFTATRKIRELGKDIPIVALTASIESEIQKRCIDAGMNDYLSKPVKLKELEAVIRQYILRNQQLSSQN